MNRDSALMKDLNLWTNGFSSDLLSKGFRSKNTQLINVQ